MTIVRHFFLLYMTFLAITNNAPVLSESPHDDKGKRESRNNAEATLNEKSEFLRQSYKIEDQPFLSPTRRKILSNKSPLYASDQDRDKIAKQFETYYKCLEQKTLVFRHNVLPIEANLYQEEMSVTLNCNHCFRPDQNPDNLNIHWRRRLVFQDWAQEMVSIDHEKFILSPEKNLLIHGISVDDSGQYVCFVNNVHMAVHHIDVVKQEQFTKVVDHGIKGKAPEQPTVLKENNLLLYTSWSPWGQCSKCNGYGQRQRLGTCTLKKLQAQSPVTPHDMPMLQHYPKGVPCRSALLPPFIANLEAVTTRRSETQLGNCAEPCPTVPAIRTITDSDGNVVEVVEAGKGVMSMKEGRPTLPPFVKRKTLYQQVRTPLIIACPHKQAHFMAVRWQNGTSVINPLSIKRRSRGRVRIDPKNRLSIRRLRMWDGNVYSCWIKGEHIASIKLRVIEKTNRSWSDYVIIGGVSMTGLVLLLIGCKVAKLQRSRGRTLK